MYNYFYFFIFQKSEAKSFIFLMIVGPTSIPTLLLMNSSTRMGLGNRAALSLPLLNFLSTHRLLPPVHLLFCNAAMKGEMLRYQAPQSSHFPQNSKIIFLIKKRILFYHSHLVPTYFSHSVAEDNMMRNVLRGGTASLCTFIWASTALYLLAS